MFGRLDTQRQAPEGNISGLSALRVDRLAVIVDEAAAYTRLHGKVLVGQTGEGCRVIVDEVAVGAVGDPGIAHPGRSVVIIIFQVSYTELRVRGKVSLCH